MSLLTCTLRATCQCTAIWLLPAQALCLCCATSWGRRSVNNIAGMHEQGGNSGERTQIFRLSDYDCVGFDLDNTILRYNIHNIVRLEYDALAKFLVEERGYAADYLQRPLTKTDLDFLQKGLVLDYEKGNVLQLASDGSIQQVTHGTTFLKDEEVVKGYGQDRCSALTCEYVQDILGSWNGPRSEKIRACLDYFDIPAPLAFARCVDCIDANAVERPQRYGLYNDITAGLINMYSYENFEKGTGNFFTAVKKNPDLFLHRCSPSVVNWLKKLKKDKVTFLITGSYVDFASFTAEYCLGENWQSLFDIIIFLARKPGFFTGDRPFFKVVNGTPEETPSLEELKFGCSYTQGNWKTLYDLFKSKTCLNSPKCVYIGDNIVQDVYAVDKNTCCDTVAVSEEMCCEGVGEENHDVKVISSSVWGSYFADRANKTHSLWGSLIQKHATICVPNLDTLADMPLDFQIQSFGCKSPDSSKPIGFFPKSPYLN